jgi:hypothetical protein
MLVVPVFFFFFLFGTLVVRSRDIFFLNWNFSNPTPSDRGLRVSRFEPRPAGQLPPGSVNQLL